MDIEWTAAAVDPPLGEAPPSPDSWRPVEVPGRPSSFAGAEAVVYRGRFPDPRDSDRQRALLTIDGAYAGAVVWLEGRRVAEGDHVVPIRVPFDPAPDNEVLVACLAPDRFGGLEASAAVPATAGVPSIRWDVDVRPIPDPAVLALSARGRPGEESTVEVSATVETTEPLSDYLTFSLRPEGFRAGGAMERAEVRADPGERVTVERSLRVRDERRWFPRELGAQDRYTVRATLGEHERTVTTGLVAVERDGGDLLVNGRRHRPRGVIVPPTADPEWAVDRALEANATLLRARAHLPSPALYEACDEAGLLLWQDLPLTGPGGFDPEQGSAIARAIERERGNHPSLACYGVHDEPVRPFEDGLGDGRLDRLRVRWRAWRASYDRANAEAIAGALPADRAQFPVIGPPGIEPDACTCYPGWQYLDADAVEWLLDRDPRPVVGAFGAGSLARATDGPVPGLRGAASDVFEAGPARSQAAQARTVRTVAEALRRRDVGTIVLDALVDAAPEGGMGVLAADGTEKPAYRSLASVFRPVQALLNGPPAPGTLGVTVCNDTGVDRSGTLSWSAGAHEGDVDVTVDPFGRADAGTIDVPDDAEGIVLDLALDEGSVTTTYDLTGDR